MAIRVKSAGCELIGHHRVRIEQAGSALAGIDESH